MKRILLSVMAALSCVAVAQDISLDEDDGGISLGEKAEKKLSGEELAAKAKADKEARVIARLKASAAAESDPKKREKIERKVYETLKNSDAETWRNLYYFAEEGMLPRGQVELTHDFCHPNDAGMRVMGPAYAKRIREVLEADAALGRKAPLAVDFATAKGPVKPVNGVGQPPITGHSDTGMFSWLKKAGAPCSRRFSK